MRTKLFAGIAAMLLFASCEKKVEFTYGNNVDNSSALFLATTESSASTRTSLSNYTDGNGCYSLNWSSGDAISISDGVNTAVYTTEDSYSSTAEFECSEGKISNKATEYVAFYPSTITAANMVLPSNRKFLRNNVEDFPMRAVSNNKELAFKNLCGILRLSLKSEGNNPLAVSSIALSADKGMSGAFTVGIDNAAVVTGTDGVVLECDEPENIYTTIATDFNVVAPQGDYNPLKVKIRNASGKEVNLISEGAVSVKRSRITRITLTLAESTFGTSLETIPITDADVNFTER